MAAHISTELALIPLTPLSRDAIPNHALGDACRSDHDAAQRWLVQHGNAHTRRAYARELKRGLIWASLLNKPWAACSLDDWIAFADALRDPAIAKNHSQNIADHELRRAFEQSFPVVPARGKTLAKSAKRAKYALLVLRPCFEWLRDQGWLQRVPLPRERSTSSGDRKDSEDIRTKTMAENIAARKLSESQVNYLREALQIEVDAWSKSHESARTQFVMTWLINSGVRREGLARANTADFQDVKGVLFWVVLTKRGKVRYLPVTQAMKDAWSRYATSRQLIETLPTPPGQLTYPLVTWLPSKAMPSPTNEVHAATIYEIVKAFVRKAAELVPVDCIDDPIERSAAELDRLRLLQPSPHWFRHLFATSAITAEVDLKVLQQLLGHASIQTTAAYQHPGDVQLADAAEAISRQLARRGPPR